MPQQVSWVSSSDLANTTIKADNQASEQTLWLRTYEGGTYSAWDSLTFTTTGSAAAVAQPVGSIADQTVAAGSSLNLSEILSSTNADGGSYSWFNVYDATGGNNFVKNGVEIDASAGAWVSSSDLANNKFQRRISLQNAAWNSNVCRSNTPNGLCYPSLRTVPGI